MSQSQDDLNIQRQLIILTLVDELKDPSKNDLMELALRSMYMDYFSFQEHYDHLLKSKFISESLRKSETRIDSSGKALMSVDITSEGLELLNNMRELLSVPVRKFLSELLQEQIRKDNDDHILATYKVSEQGNFIVHLEYDDGRYEHFCLEISTSNENRARLICHRFKENPSSIYLATLESVEKELLS